LSAGLWEGRGVIIKKKGFYRIVAIPDCSTSDVNCSAKMT
jgi:hypothetical protein